MRSEQSLRLKQTCLSGNVFFGFSQAYARSLYSDDDATLGDLREAVTTLEETAPIARRVLGGAHPDVIGIERSLRNARAALRARETPPPPPPLPAAPQPPLPVAPPSCFLWVTTTTKRMPTTTAKWTPTRRSQFAFACE